MNMNFIKHFLHNTNFSDDAFRYILSAIESANKNGDVNELTELFFASDFDIKLISEKIKIKSEQSGISPHTLWLLLLACGAEYAKEVYKKNATEKIYWDTFADLKYKTEECKRVNGIYGITVPDWYPRFYRGTIFKLGCMQYDIDKYIDTKDKPYTYGDITVTDNDFVLGIHIPSSGEAFDSKARLDSYKKAYEFFKPQLNNKPMACGCHSWLLYPDYKDVFPKDSNIASFREEFDIQSVTGQKRFYDAWRVYGTQEYDNTDILPQDTTLQRNFKAYIQNEGKYGYGCGVLLFDGEKILTKKEQKG